MADTVLVTGGSGYIGGWCVAQLLQQGHTVRATVRDLKREDEVRRAIATVAPQAADPSGPLSFHPASLEKDEGWGEAVSGCRYVLHVASPVPLMQPKDPDELVKPARDGALRVLKAAVDAACERVVMTSSVAAVGEYGAGAADESHWTDLNDKRVSPYSRSKTLAEKAARDFMADHHAATSFVTVNPSLVLGPVMSPDASPSVEVVARMLKGQVPALPNVGFCIVDVRDVAALHIKAMTEPQAANGRYIAAGDFMWMADIAQILRSNLGDKASKVPTGRMPDWAVRLLAPVNPTVRAIIPFLGSKRAFDAGKAQLDLGWTPRPAKETILETAQSLMKTGAV